MTIRVRTGWMLIAALAMMGLASCGHYTCGANFGTSTCTAGTVSLSGGGGGSTAAAYVYLINGSASPGSMVSYTLNTNAVPPTLLATSNYTPPATPSHDAGIGMTVAQKQFLYAAFGSTQQIFGWSIGTTGSLTPVQNSPTPVAVTPFSATEFDTQRVITNPAGTLLFVGDEFSNHVFVYQIGSGGVLTAVAGSPFSVSFPAGNMTTDGQGKYLYFTDSTGAHSGSEIAGYSIGTGTGSALGALTAVPGNPFFAANFDMWQVQGEPTGQFLIGTTGVNSAVDSNLYVFSIAQSGALSTPVLYPTTNPPVNIAVQQNTGGNLIYSLGSDSTGAFNPVEGYQLTSGVLTKVNGSPFSVAAVGDTAQFDQSGGLLFVYGGVFDGKSVIYTLTSFDVSAGNLTTPTATGTFGGYWVITDAP